MVAEKKRTASNDTEQIAKYVRRNEAHRIFDAAPDDRARLLLTLLWTTGGRITEVLRLRPSDIEEKDRLVLLNEKQTKVKKGAFRKLAYKHIYVPENVIQQIQNYAHANGIDGNSFVFPGRFPGSHLSGVTAWRIVKKAAGDAQVERDRDTEKMGFRRTAAYPHLFRHGLAVSMLDQGANLGSIQGQLGHASVATTAIYLKVVDETRRADVQRLKF